MILPDGVRQLLARHEGVFSTGDAGDLAVDYRNPVAVFLPGGLRVEETPEVTRAVLRRLQAMARAQGVVRVRPLLVGVRAVRPDRPVVAVSWQFLDAQGREVARNRLSYFCAQQPDGRLMIEMLEYERTAFEGDGAAWPPRS
ncbi:MAG: hypothetical protein MUF73_06685 [Rhodobacteraceae bacterium]|jgi:hypothetical protein|nr:hypothetical protein [Paracoccaceae bacterium]